MPTNLQFVSWSRRGVAAGDVSAPAQADGRLHVSRRFVVTTTPRDGTPVTVPAGSAEVTVLGPGDVVGLDRAQVLRRSPRPDDHNLEPNYLATIEFAHPDLPWMFSPELGAGERAQPWLMLVVLPDPEGQAVAPTGIGKPCPVLTVPSAAAVPDPSTAWAFAHVQALAKDAPEAVRLVSAPASNGAVVRSRILSPTRLRPDQRYVAALVPTYEIGRLAGLGQAIPGGTGSSLWTPVAGLQLPVYDSWRFWTGPSGDFETLAKKLRGVDPGTLATLGVRTVAIEAKSSLMQPQGPEAEAFAGVHQVPTALTRIAPVATSGLAPDAADPDPQAHELHTRLKEVVDRVAGATSDDPVVGPPLYGQWPAEVTSLDGDPGTTELGQVPVGSAQTWIEQLNADPFLRAAAGLATRVVQHDQEDLMADAWTQLEQLHAANNRIRWASLYAHTAVPLHDRVTALAPDAALRLLSPATSRLRESAQLTFRGRLEGSTVPPEALGSTLARTARYAVRAQARLLAAGGEAPGERISTSAVLSGTLEALRTGVEAALPSRYTAARAIDPSVVDELSGAEQFRERLTDRLGTDPASYVERIRDVPRVLERVAGRLVVQPGDPGLATGEGTRVRLRAEARTNLVALARLATRVHTGGELQLSDQVRTELTAIRADGADQPISLATVSALNEAVRFQDPRLRTRLRPVDLAVEVQEVHLDRRGVEESISLVSVGAPAKQARAGETIAALRATALTELGLTEVGLGRVVSQVTTAEGRRLHQLVEEVGKDLAPVGGPVATPELERLDLGVATRLVGRLEPLRAYERLLAFAHQFAEDGVVTRRPGSEFHPAMAAPLFPRPAVERLRSLDEEWILGGLGQLAPNSVCLLAVNWRFVESFLAGANHEMARELLWRGYPTDLRGSCFRRFWNSPADDIRPMDHWDQPIGSHGASAGGRKEFTILLVKGDLLRRYPSTIIAAEKGTASKEGEEVGFTSEEHHPELFRGFLGQDISYVAIDVPPSDLRFSDAANPRHCWYISLTEPHEEPRFGLDEEEGDAPGSNAARADPDDWSWEGLADPTAPHLMPADVAAEPSSARAGSNLFQRPFRMLLRARDYV